MTKMMLIGKTSVGKTSLIQALYDGALCDKKTQAVEYYDNFLDLPGEYLENPRFYNVIVTLSHDVDLIALVQDVECDQTVFPPNFGTMFNKPVIGIITKIDLLIDSEKRDRVRSDLEQAGALKIYEVSNISCLGLHEIWRLIHKA